jgi:peptidoglycan/xylan/chitin deacetylase (PgdA/CDA1 family)
MKTFALRIDLESDLGIREGVPQILDLLKKHNIKASFYLTMGGESGLFDLLRYRKKLPGKRNIKVFSKLELLRMALFPKDFVTSNQKILKRILIEGHELGIHGWKHRAWTRALERIDIEDHIDKSINKYKQIFKKDPISFCSPAFRTNETVIKILEKKKIIVISDFEGDSPKKIRSDIVNVPITIKGKGNTPIIEYLAGIGLKDNEILSELQKQIKARSCATIYMHCLYECREKINLLNDLFTWINKQKIETKRIMDYAKT